MDGLAGQYAHLSSYNYADNNPINDFDIDGMQEEGAETKPSQQADTASTSPANQPTVEIDIENVDPECVYKSDLTVVPIENTEVSSPLVSETKPEKSANLAAAPKPATSEADKKIEQVREKINSSIFNNAKGEFLGNFKTKSGTKQETINKQQGGSNKNSTTASSSGQQRIEKALSYKGQLSYGTTRPTPDKQTNCADFIVFIIKQTNPQIGSKLTYSSAGNLYNQLKQMKVEMRQDNPLLGDVAIWYNAETEKGHFEFVSSVKDGNVAFFGARGPHEKAEPSYMSKSPDYHFKNDPQVLGPLGQGKVFVGYWTPQK